MKSSGLDADNGKSHFSIVKWCYREGFWHLDVGAIVDNHIIFRDAMEESFGIFISDPSCLLSLNIRINLFPQYLIYP